MRIRRENFILLVLLPFVTAVCIFMWHMDTSHFFARAKFVDITSADGTYDLTCIDFYTTVAHVTGDVEFVPDVLLTPDEFDEYSSAGKTQYGKPQFVSNVSTSRIRLILPAGAAPQGVNVPDVYGIALRSIDFAETIFINGILHASAGQPGMTRDTEQAGYALWSFTATPSELSDGQGGAVMEIVQQASNFVHRDSGGHTGVYVGNTDDIRLLVARKTSSDAITIGLFIVLFLVHLTFYSILRSYRANLYFSMLCLTWALRTGVLNSKLIPGAIPLITWEAAFRIEYLSIPAAAIFTALIINEIFPDIWLKWPFRAVICVSAVFGVLFLFTDTLFMSYSLIWYNVFYITAEIWLVIRFIQWIAGRLKTVSFREAEGDSNAFSDAINRGVPIEHWVSLYGIAVFLYAAVHDAFFYNNIYLFGLGMPLTGVSMLIFSFSQMVTISRITMREFAAVRDAERELAEKNAVLEGTLLEAVNKSPRTVVHGTLTLDVISGQAFLYGNDMLLSPKEFAVLRLLLVSNGNSISAEQIYREVWNAPFNSDSTALKTTVSRLRRKLKGSGFFISYSRSEGYCLLRGGEGG